nr:hypothetical protein [Candidatus Sigynarchaeum springense]
MPKKRTAPARPGGEREIEPEWKVENVVTTATMNVTGDKGIDLNQIARKHPDCEELGHALSGVEPGIGEDGSQDLI